MMNQSLYKEDFHAWAYMQARFVKNCSWNEIDIENLVEELNSMGNEREHELTSRLKQLLIHLLKWQYQPERRSRSWLNTMDCQRAEIEYLLRKNRSLKSVFCACVDDAYSLARRFAANETGLSKKIFPAFFPFPWDEFLLDDWLPE